MALTDHDTTPGWAEARDAARAHGIRLVRGIEVSCGRRDRSIHLLAYLPDPDDPDLVAELARARDSRDTRLDRMVGLMAADGIPVTLESVRAEVEPGATAGRPHIADALVTAGVVAHRDEAFARWLGNDSPYYVSHYAPDPVRAVELVRAAGGVPVIAHPWSGTRGRVVGDALVEEMAAAGLAGLEVHHRDHSADAVRHLGALARSLGLLGDRVERLPRRGQAEPAGGEHDRARGARGDRGAGDRDGRGGAVSVRPHAVHVDVRHAARHPRPAGRDPDLPGAHRAADGEAEGGGRPPGLAGGARGDRARSRVFGQRILDYLHISLPALQGAGGLLLLIVALQLLTGSESEQLADAGVNVALVPLGTPLLAGPGAIVATMLAVQGAEGAGGYLAVALALVTALLVVYLTFRFASPLARLLKDSGIVLLTRIAGLLLSAIAVQMIADSVIAFANGAGAT